MQYWQKMNLANKVTMVRFLLVPVFILIVTLFHGWFADLLAGLVFIVAACTDFIDGHIARSRNLISTFGKFMDPLVDKILVTAALVALVALGRVPAWVVILILAREFAITGLRTVAVSSGVVIAASKLGKWKTACQMVALALLLLYTLPFLPNTFIYVLGQVLLYAALVLTYISGWDYLKGCRGMLSDM